MSNILLLMAGVSGDGQAIAWKPQDDVPKQVELLHRVLRPKSDAMILFEVTDSTLDLEIALDELTKRVQGSETLLKLSRGEVPLLTDPTTTGFSVAECPATDRSVQFGVSISPLGVVETPASMVSLAFTDARARRAAWDWTNRRSGPIEEFLLSFYPYGLAQSPQTDYQDMLTRLIVGTDACILVTGS